MWLEGWLRAYEGTLLLIAHDREFLDRVVNRIVNIENQKAQAWRGNYSAFEEARAAQLAQQSAMFEKQQREIAHMEAFVERFRAQATKARQAQSRLKALERMQRIAPAHVDSPFQFSFAEPLKLPRPLLAIENQSAGYGDRVLLQGCEPHGVSRRPHHAHGAQRCRQVDADQDDRGRAAGARRHSHGCARSVARLFRAAPARTARSRGLAAAAILRGADRWSAGATTEQEQRDYLAGFGFRGDRVFENVGPFSGGEKARLALALVAYSRPNLLLLDEPTNHLDLEMRQALAMALQEYAGAVIMVSHDRHLLSTVTDRFLLVDGGRVEIFDGDLDGLRALARRRRRRPPGPPRRRPRPPAAKAKPKPATPAAPRVNPSVARARLARCEKKLQELAVEAARLDALLAAPGLYAKGDGSEARELNAQRARIAAETEQLETEWLELGEQLEARLPLERSPGIYRCPARSRLVRR